MIGNEYEHGKHEIKHTRKKSDRPVDESVTRTTSSHGRDGEPAYASVMGDGDDTTEELPGKKIVQSCHAARKGSKRRGRGVDDRARRRPADEG